MNTRSSLFSAATTAALIAAFGCAQANAAWDTSTMSIDARAPVHATLLPTISVTADSANPDLTFAARVAATDALPVTLMPTVRVTAQAPSLAISVLPAVRVYATTERADEDDVAAAQDLDDTLPHVETGSVAYVEPTRPLRLRTMPR